MRNYNILILENQYKCRDSFQEALADSLFVPYFSNGKKNIIAVLNTETFDAVIIDYDSPGFDACMIAEQIRTYKSGLPVLLVSDNAILLRNDSYLLSISDEIIQKPISSNQLITRLKWHLKVTKRTNNINQLFFEKYLENKVEMDISFW
ncbi:MAG: response regulator [Bacteroidales bacterium]|nr:response regulator [Bacteroidales bacterium]